MTPRPFHIYRHYAADGALLYVGLTCNPETRPYVRDRRPWLDDTVRVEVSEPMSHAAATLAERTAIRDERPAHNVYANNGNLTDAYRFWQSVADEMTPEEYEVADRAAVDAISKALSVAS